MDNNTSLSKTEGARNSDWFKELNKIAKQNLSTFGNSQARFGNYRDFEKIMGNK